MAINYDKLAAELAGSHPTTSVVYATLNDQQAADALNELNRPRESSSDEILQYCMLETSRTNLGAIDTQRSNIYGRIAMVADGAVGDNPFQTGRNAENLTLRNIHAAKTMLRLLADFDFMLSLADARFEFILDELVDAGAIKPGDKTAIQGFSINQQSRVQEIEIGRKKVKAEHVAQARKI